MKKLILLLLFIPLLSFSQSYKDLMSINSVDMFKKAVIENGYEFSSEKDWDITYGFNIMRDSIDGDKSIKWAYYNTNNDRWTFTFSRSNMLNKFASALSEVVDHIKTDLLPEEDFSAFEQDND